MHGTNSPPSRYFKLSSAPLSSMHVTQSHMNLSLTHSTVSEIHEVITAANKTCNSAQVYLSHPTTSIKVDHVRRLQTSMRPSNTHHLSNRVIYYYLLTSVRSPLIPSHRYLLLTMNNTTHILTPKGMDSLPTRQHYLRLFLNSYKESPYLHYTYEGGHHNNCTISTQRLTITINLPSSLISSKRPTRHCMIPRITCLT